MCSVSWSYLPISPFSHPLSPLSSFSSVFVSSSPFTKEMLPPAWTWVEPPTWPWVIYQQLHLWRNMALASPSSHQLPGLMSPVHAGVLTGSWSPSMMSCWLASWFLSTLACWLASWSLSMLVCWLASWAPSTLACWLASGAPSTLACWLGWILCK